jgi:hypothetical protein
MTRGAGWTPPGDGAEVAPGTAGYDMTMARAAVTLGVLPQKLAEWRKKRVGPSYRRESEQRNSAIFYAEAEVKAARKALDEFRDREPKDDVRARIRQADKPAKRRSRR